MKVILPVKSGSGVKVAFKSFSSENKPGTLADHVPNVAAPPMVPLSNILVLTQKGSYKPASAVASG